MPIAVVLLHYNRWSNLRLALRALKEQTLPLSEFHVVVADDGSTDETVDQMHRLVKSPEWEGRLHFISGGPHHGARLSRIHNIGIANIPPECSFFVLLASDMCLAPDALEQFAYLHYQNPQAVIISRLDWLPPIKHDQIEKTWDEHGFHGLFSCVPEELMHLVEHTPVGKEHRPLTETATLQPFNSQIFHPVYGLPTKLYWRAGGYDEDMVGYGFQELDFGLRLEQAGASMVTTQQIRSLHIWHPKDVEVRDLVPWQRQKNTAYMLRKHGSHPKPLNYRNWAYWRHYHQVHGGTAILCIDEQPGLYVANKERTHCLRLPHAGWLHPLGFATMDVEFTHRAMLTNMVNMGEATDLLSECDFSTLTVDLGVLLQQRLQMHQGWQATPTKQRYADHKHQSGVLEQLFLEYDAMRNRSDNLPGAAIPLLGFVIRMLARMVFAGKVWAAEYRLFKAFIYELERFQRNESAIN